VLSSLQDQKVNQVLSVQSVRKDLPDRKDSPEVTAIPELRETSDHQDQSVSRERSESPEQKENPVSLDLQDHPEYLVDQDL
jgi:hypothetical protein